MPHAGKPTRLQGASHAIGLLAITLVAGCAGIGGTSSAATDPVPSATPRETSSPIATPAIASTPTPASTEDANPAPLPVAEIITPDATIVGELGTYAIDGRGSDAPWLPFSSIPPFTVGTADSLTIRFSDGVPIGDWAAVIAGADDLSGLSPQGIDGALKAADGLTVSIGPLPVGRWVLQVRLFRADGRGDGLTYWAVTVR